MNTISYTNENGRISLQIDNEEVGFLKLLNVGGAFQIDKIEIDEEFRGRGFYKGLLIAGLQLTGADMLISNDRNSISNPIYENWTGSELAKDEQCNVYINRETLIIEVDEYQD